MKKSIEGKAFVLGDNIDTDQIIPAEHLVYSLSDPEELKNYGRFALSGVPPKNAGLPGGNIPFIEGDKFSSAFSIIVGGSNFGCGSSREHAPFALKVAGVKVIVAESYARIFYRNSVDGGFVVPYISSTPLKNLIETGNNLIVDLENDTLTNVLNGETYKLDSLGSILPIIEAGNIFSYARNNNMI